jgi:hypothetical protein
LPCYFLLKKKLPPPVAVITHGRVPEAPHRGEIVT